jgi:hypothetical protein
LAAVRVALLTDRVPHAVAVSRALRHLCWSRVARDALAAALERGVGFGIVPQAKRVADAPRLVVVNAVNLAIVCAHRREEVPRALRVTAATFRSCVLEEALHAAALLQVGPLAQRSGRAGRLIKKFAKTSASSGHGVPQAVNLRVAGWLGVCTILTLGVAGTVDSQYGSVGRPRTHCVGRASSAEAVKAAREGALELWCVLDAVIRRARRAARTEVVVPDAPPVTVA